MESKGQRRSDSKCDTNTIGVELVLALVASVQEHQANKCILVTTTSFGPASKSIKTAASIGAVELLTGAELLGIMKDLDIPGYMNITEARRDGGLCLENRRKRKKTPSSPSSSSAMDVASHQVQPPRKKHKTQ